MKNIITIITLILIFLQSCGQNSNKKLEQIDSLNVVADKTVTKSQIIDSKAKTIDTRFLLPSDYQRIKVKENSFAEYLRKLPLKPVDAKVKYYNGTIKANHNTYAAVIDLKIGKKNLHQCADAVMRLRAEYLWRQKRYDEIHFNFTNGFRVDYSEWMKGRRVVVKGNKSYWVNSKSPSNTYADFWNYMESIFMYAGTLSLSKELKHSDIKNLKIGDIFIKGGSPGHAIIVIDMAINSITNKKIFLLSQSYMPAQDMQVLINPNDNNLSPWYSADIMGNLITPEWTFKLSEIKRF